MGTDCPKSATNWSMACQRLQQPASCVLARAFRSLSPRQAHRRTHAESALQERFLSDFGDPDAVEDDEGVHGADAAEKDGSPALGDTPAEHQALFAGNTDDHFRLGIKLTRWQPATHQIPCFVQPRDADGNAYHALKGSALQGRPAHIALSRQLTCCLMLIRLTVVHDSDRA